MTHTEYSFALQLMDTHNMPIFYNKAAHIVSLAITLLHATNLNYTISQWQCVIEQPIVDAAIDHWHNNRPNAFISHKVCSESCQEAQRDPQHNSTVHSVNGTLQLLQSLTSFWCVNGPSVDSYTNEQLSIGLYTWMRYSTATLSILSFLPLLMTPPLPPRAVRFLNVRRLCSQQQTFSTRGIPHGRSHWACPCPWSPIFHLTHMRRTAKPSLSFTSDQRKHRLRALRVS